MDVCEDSISKITGTAEKYNRTITFLPVDQSVKQIKELNAGSWNGSLATWLKIFVIEDLIPKIDRLLYLDSDTLVLGSLKELCDMDFDGMAMACIIDSLSFEQIKRLNMSQNRYYYNAGMTWK